MTVITASIHCHTRQEVEAVRDYVTSQRYQTILFADGANLSISQRPLGTGLFDAVIAPGNSFGEMSGGFDEALVNTLGNTLQQNVTRVIKDQHYGELNVGAAIVVPTERSVIPFCAYAPTMRVPKTLPPTTDIPYLATRAALLALLTSDVKWPHGELHVLIPLMGVGTGGLDIATVCSQIQIAVGSLMPHHGEILSLEDGVHYDDVIHGARPFASR